MLRLSPRSWFVTWLALAGVGLVLGLIVANIAGHATVALLYRRDRT